MTTITKEEFTKHACEQVLRFSIVEKWDDLSEARKVQLGFNMGAMSLALNLSKEDGFMALFNVRTGEISMQEFRKHIANIVAKYNIKVEEKMIELPF
ncbi:MAG: hypothetical protein N4A38_05730 [Candidatus Gracilibacteria bacterium]|nr:hypothetical protein [Candidatus Gracilibacteria bacterium]